VKQLEGLVRTQPETLMCRQQATVRALLFRCVLVWPIPGTCTSRRRGAPNRPRLLTDLGGDTLDVHNRRSENPRSKCVPSFFTRNFCFGAVLTMLCSSQRRWDFAFFSSSGFVKTMKHSILETGSVPVLR
jgi:hypothetical protein